MRIFSVSFPYTDYTSTYEELAHDNNSGQGMASKLNITAPHTGYFLIVVHAYTNTMQGLGDLWFNGLLDESSIQIGGRHAYTCQLRSGDRVHSMFEPLSDGASHHQMLVTSSPSGPAFGYREDLSPSGGRGTDYTHDGATTGAWNSVFVSSSTPFGGRISQIWNDAIDDDDEDGLGNLLEESIGTCPNSGNNTVTKEGWDCSRYDSRDSDQDGISDYDELLGTPGIWCTSSPFQCIHQPTPLRWWGADPAQKDVFIEVNYDDRFLNHPTTGDLKDEFGSAQMQALYDVYSAAPAHDVGNPNGVPGIRLHFEVENSDTVSFPGNPTFVFHGDESAYMGDEGSGYLDDCFNYNSARSQYMLARRKPFFRFMCASPPGTGGQATRGGRAFRANARSAYVIAHELGHVLGLGHGGQDNFNGKPHYQSLMSYGYGISAGFSAHQSIPLNPTSLCETDGLGPGNPVGYLQDHPFFYDAFSGSVDWNRNGNHSSCSTNIRAPITWAPTTGTGMSSLGRAQEFLFSPETTPTGAIGTPALNRISVGGVETLYLLYSNGSHLRYRWTNFPDDCPRQNPDLKESDCGDWSGSLNGTYLARTISSRHFSINGVETIIAATTRSNGVVRILRYDPNPQSRTLSSSLIATNLGTADGDVAIEEYNGQLIFVWRNLAGQIEEARMDDSGQITPAGVISDPSGHPWTTNTSPALATHTQLSNLYMLRTQSNNRLDILWRNGSGNWVPSGIFSIPDTNAYRTLDKPGFAWQPYDRVDNPNGPGHFWIAFPSLTTRRLHAVYLSSDDVLIGQMHNSWSYAKDETSVTLLHVEGESNLRAAYIRPPKELDGVENDQIMFFPYADGIWDYDLVAINDFELMSSGTCLGLMDENDFFCGPLSGWNGLWASYMFFDPVNNESEPDCDLL